MRAKKSTIAIAAVLAFLAVGVAVLAMIGSKEAAARKQLLEREVFQIVIGGSRYEITALGVQSLGPREIQANYKTNGKAAETRTYMGVPFAEVLRLTDIDLAGLKTATFAAADAYVSILPIQKALDEENCFIVLDGGGEGPFRMILAKDQFSQNWCKLLTDVTLK